LTNIQQEHSQNILDNIHRFNINNFFFDIDNIVNSSDKNFVVYSNNYKDIDVKLIEQYNPIILTETNIKLIKKYEYTYEISNTNLLFYIPEEYNDLFKEQFKFYLHP